MNTTSTTNSYLPMVQLVAIEPANQVDMQAPATGPGPSTASPCWQLVFRTGQQGIAFLLSLKDGETLMNALMVANPVPAPESEPPLQPPIAAPSSPVAS